MSKEVNINQPSFISSPRYTVCLNVLSS